MVGNPVARSCQRIAERLSRAFSGVGRRYPGSPVGGQLRDAMNTARAGDRAAAARVTSARGTGPPEGPAMKPPAPGGSWWTAEAPASVVNKAIAEDLSARHGFKVTGFDTPGLDTHTVREIAAALDDMLRKYPRAGSDILSLEIGRPTTGEHRWAETRPHWSGPGEGPLRFGSRLLFSETHAQNPEWAAEMMREAVRAGHLAPGSDLRPVYSTMVHEFGHVLANSGESRAVRAADDVLQRHYARTYGSGGHSAEAFERWRAQLPSYSFWVDGRFHPTEAVAEAFTDVELNGTAASEPAQLLHRTLLDAAEMTWRMGGSRP